MTIYAAQTVVSPEKSKAEIENMLRRYGASGFASGWQGGSSTIIFEHSNRRVRFNLPEPSIDAFRTIKDSRGYTRKRSEGDACRAHEQAIRACWRALALVIKAKLEAVESGITTFEEEFLAHIVTPTGTIGEILIPQLEAIRNGAKLPPMLGAGSGR